MPRRGARGGAGCPDFYRTDRPVFTASSWQVQQPLYTRAVGRWRAYEKHLGPLLEVLGGADSVSFSADLWVDVEE